MLGGRGGSSWAGVALVAVMVVAVAATEGVWLSTRLAWSGAVA